MKKKIILLLAVILVLPIHIEALELKCPKGPYSKDNTFECTLSNEILNNYKSIKANISSGNGINCYISNLGNGMISNSNESTTIDISGTATDSDLLYINCIVNHTDSNPINTTVTLDNLSYVLADDTKEENLIIRSDYIDLMGYVEEIDDKPRDISNPNTLLKELSIENINFIFSKLILTYNIQVPYETTNLKINYTPNVEGAIINITQPDILAIGNNTIDIYITSPDQTSTNCYTLNIKRLNKGEEVYYKEKDATLKDLIIKDNTIEFESKIDEYKIKIDSNTDKLEIEAIPTIVSATYTISKTDELENGDIISIIVTSEDKTTTKEYKIIIEKEIEKPDYTKYYILGGAGALILIIILFIIISNNKNQRDPLMKLKNEKKKKEKNIKTNENDIPVANEEIKPITTVEVIPEKHNDNQETIIVDEPIINDNQIEIANKEPSTDIFINENVPVDEPQPQNIDTTYVETIINDQVIQTETKTSINEDILIEEPIINTNIISENIIQNEVQSNIIEPNNIVSNISENNPNINTPIINNTTENVQTTNNIIEEQIQINKEQNKENNTNEINLDDTLIIKGNQNNILPMTPDTPKLPNDQ